MNAIEKSNQEQLINELIAPQDQAFTLPDGIVVDGTDFVPTVQYLM
jgi:hypothetical protein